MDKNRNRALKLLKAGYILTDKKEKILVRYDKKIIVICDNYIVKLDDYEFLSLYGEYEFVISDKYNNEEEIDPQKDKEYYSFRQ